MTFDFMPFLKEIINMDELDKVNIKIGGHNFVITRQDIAESCICHEIGKNGTACDDTI